MGFVGLDDTYTDSGEPDALLEKYNLTAEAIAEQARLAVGAKQKVAL